MPADTRELDAAERSDSVRRTISSLLENLPQEPKESELLLVSCLQKSLTSQSTSSTTPRRKSVIEKTPVSSPGHHLSPQEPAITPGRTPILPGLLPLQNRVQGEKALWGHTSTPIVRPSYTPSGD